VANKIPDGHIKKIDKLIWEKKFPLCWGKCYDAYFGETFSKKRTNKEHLKYTHHLITLSSRAYRPFVT
jgi:hypothetical protein